MTPSVRRAIVLLQRRYAMSEETGTLRIYDSQSHEGYTLIRYEESGWELAEDVVDVGDVNA